MERARRIGEQRNVLARVVRPRSGWVATMVSGENDQVIRFQTAEEIGNPGVYFFEARA